MSMAIPNRWFRMYSEFATDPKVQMLSEADQRRYIMVLCLRCSNGDVTLHDDEVAFQLRISNDEWSKTKAVLTGKQLIDENNLPIKWDQRQYASDSSAARVAKHRANKKELGNVTVTPQRTEADTDTDKSTTDVVDKAAEKPPRFYPLKFLQAQGVEKQVAADWIALRKGKRLESTMTAFEAVIAEANKVGRSLNEVLRNCCARGWGSFKASWDHGLNGDGGAVSGHLFMSGPGIEAKAAELGVIKADDEMFSSFRDRVYLKAGVTPEMIRTAKIDAGERV